MIVPFLEGQLQHGTNRATPNQTLRYSKRQQKSSFRLRLSPTPPAPCRGVCQAAGVRPGWVHGTLLTSADDIEMTPSDRLEKARQESIRAHMEAPVLALLGYAEMLSEQISVLSDRMLAEELAADNLRIEQAATQLKEMLGAILAQDAEGKSSMDDLQIVRHDMRNAIGAVSGYAALVAETLSDESALEGALEISLTGLQRESETLLETLDQSSLSGSPDPVGRDEVEDLFASLSAAEDESENIFGTILVVDDNESNRQLLSHQLVSQGHEVLSADSGRGALELMESAQPDLVLLDLMMPDMNGFEVLKFMYGRPDLRSVPVIVITGLHDQRGVVRCIEAGAQDYLLKPINPTILKARMKACLERKALHDRAQSYQRELERSYGFIRKVFGRYLSDDIVQQILDDEDGLRLGGGMQKVTIMMTDLRGFTELSQTLQPTEVVSLLNLYLQEMSEIIVRHGGSIDEIIGDAILALFGAPLVRTDDAARAVACAIEMQQAMVRVNARAKEQGLPAIEMGIGLNTGEVVVGNIGSEIRSKYAVVGHHVNLTGRIESFTVGGQILASEFTVAEVGDLLEHGASFQVDAKGIEQPVKLFEVVGIGPPWHLRLDQTLQPVESLDPPLDVMVTPLTDKQLDGPELACRMEALGGNRAVVFSDRTLDAMGNIRMRLTPDSDDGSAGGVINLYAKVIEPCAERPPGRYHVVLTSVAAAQRLQTLIELRSPS